MKKMHPSLSQKLLAWEEWLAANQRAGKSVLPQSATEGKADGPPRRKPIFSEEDADLRFINWSFSGEYPQIKFGIHCARMTLRAHQIVASRMGLYPCEQIDHINHDKGDTRRCNLRAVTHSQNQRNLKREQLIGVERARGKWYARIQIGPRGKKICILSAVYPTPERAAFAYNQLAQLFGFWTRNNVQIPAE